MTLDVEALDFGTCSRLSPSDYKSVLVTNTTSAKLTAFFAVPSWQDPLGGEPKPIFQVGPCIVVALILRCVCCWQGVIAQTNLALFLFRPNTSCRWKARKARHGYGQPA